MAKSVTNGKPKGKPRGKPFQKGVSPNPGGVPKGETSPRRIEMDARLLAREHGVEAVKKLVTIMRNEKAPFTAQLIAANAILDRGYGRPPQAVEIYCGDVRAEEQEGSALEIIESRLAAMRERLVESHPLLIQP